MDQGNVDTSVFDTCDTDDLSRSRSRFFDSLQAFSAKDLLHPAFSDFLAFRVKCPNKVTSTEDPGVDAAEVERAHVGVCFYLNSEHGERGGGGEMNWRRGVRED